MKTKHLTVRLDDETAAIVEKYQAQFGTQTSETISRLIRAADGEKFVTVVTTSIAHTDELSFFAGRLEKLKILWREVKSRLNAPRPVDPSDSDAINQWHADRQKIKTFYDECDALWRQSHALAAELTGVSADNLAKMERAAGLLKAWSDELQQKSGLSKDAEDRKINLRAKEDFDFVFEIIQRLGIKVKTI
jgi:hypothetical protein